MKDMMSAGAAVFHGPDQGGGPGGPDPGDVVIGPNGPKINNSTPGESSNDAALPSSAFRTLSTNGIQIWAGSHAVTVFELTVPVKDKNGNNPTTISVSGSAGGTPVWKKADGTELDTGGPAGQWPTAYWTLDTSASGGSYKTSANGQPQNLPTGWDKLYVGFTTA